jgi:hypothetical protein
MKLTIQPPVLVLPMTGDNSTVVTLQFRKISICYECNVYKGIFGRLKCPYQPPVLMHFVKGSIDPDTRFLSHAFDHTVVTLKVRQVLYVYLGHRGYVFLFCSNSAQDGMLLYHFTVPWQGHCYVLLTRPIHFNLAIVCHLFVSEDGGAGTGADAFLFIRRTTLGRLVTGVVQFCLLKTWNLLSLVIGWQS